MNAAEALSLCRFVKAACPQQAIDELTPDAWALILADYRFEDCQQAALQIVQESAFVAPAEIIARVKQIRGKRIAEYGALTPPDDCEDFQEWLRVTRKRIGDGELTPPARRAPDPIERAKVQAAIEGTFPRVPPARGVDRRPYVPETQATADLCSHGVQPKLCKDRSHEKTAETATKETT